MLLEERQAGSSPGSSLERCAASNLVHALSDRRKFAERIIIIGLGAGFAGTGERAIAALASFGQERAYVLDFLLHVGEPFDAGLAQFAGGAETVSDGFENGGALGFKRLADAGIDCSPKLIGGVLLFLRSDLRPSGR
jgi:hypothetical protein